MVILTIKAVEGTCLIEDGQVLEAILRAFCVSIAWITTACTPRADKVTHAVGWKGVIVIRKLSLVRPSSSQLAMLDMAYTTKAGSAIGYLTLMKT